MFKPVSAGLMCLGLATLGVTMLRGEVPVAEEEVKADIQFYDAGVVAEIGVEAELTEALAEGTTEQIVSEINVDVADLRSEIGEISVSGPEGQGVQEKFVVNFAHPAGVVDAATRETLERLIKQLREEEAKLRGGQRNDEAAQKAQTAATLEMVLKGQGPFTKIAGLRTGGKQFHEAVRVPALHARIQAEQAGLHARLAELQAKRARLQAEKPDAPELAELDRATQDLKRSLDERMDHFRIVRQKLVGVPEAAHAAQLIQFHPNAGHHRIVVAGRPEVAALNQKGEALLRAAEVLSSAGLEDKARELKEKGEKTLAEAKEQIAKAQADITFTPLGRPPVELHQALNELREQVQQLRKEVGELRALLERKQ